MTRLPRRSFLQHSLAASAAVALAARGARAADTAAPAPGRDLYEWRCYRLAAGTRLKAAADPAPVEAYLEHALLPALARVGAGPVGVFTELEVQKETATASPKPDSPLWVMIRHPSLASLLDASVTINADPAVQAAAVAYLQAPRDQPAFERIDTWLYLAFRGLPAVHVPPFSRDRVPTRVFELRDYESHSELKALNKMAMFDDGEITLMQDLGMHPVFFGEALAGPDLPHLRYITSGPDLATHLDAWKRFGDDPRWHAMRSDPQWAQNVSKNTPRFLAPRPYSQI